MDDTDAALDNIVQNDASDTQVNAADADDNDDTYMKNFDTVLNMNEEIEKLTSQLPKAQHDQERIKLLTSIVKLQSTQFENMYTLMVEMNNYFG